MTPKQLVLPFDQQAHYTAADFVSAPSNELARALLDRPADWANGRLVLWGESGCGKTHLAHLWVEANHANLLDGANLPIFAAPPTEPLAIDDSDGADETTLLHLINAAAEAGQPVLLTAFAPPARQNIALADLASRLRASQTVQILPPDDELLSVLLSRLAADRQLVLNLPVRNFLLTRLPRTPAAQREAIARLDHAAMAKGAPITRHLAAELLNDLTSP
jgi:chromosomal replication initiation ATPase DnaA